MATYTIDVPAGGVARLQAVVEAYNAANGTAFTVKGWIVQHLKEVIVAVELQAESAGLWEQAQRDAEAAHRAAVRAARDRLVASLDI